MISGYCLPVNPLFERLPTYEKEIGAITSSLSEFIARRPHEEDIDKLAANTPLMESQGDSTGIGGYCVVLLLLWSQPCTYEIAEDDGDI